MLQDLEKLVNRILNQKEDDLQIFLGELTYSIHSIPIGTPQHAVQILELIMDFRKNLYNLEKEIREELKTKNIKEKDMIKQYIYFFTAPLSSHILKS